MILDRQNTVSQAQAITATAVSTDTIDLGVARDLGVSGDLKWVVTVDQVFNNLTSLEIQAISSANANLSSANVIGSTGAIVLAQLTAGRRPIVLSLPRSLLSTLPVGQRYIGLNYVVVGTAPTTGQVTAGLVLGVQDIGKVYASGYSLT
jgi:hypothetical protein